MQGGHRHRRARAVVTGSTTQSSASRCSPSWHPCGACGCTSASPTTLETEPGADDELLAELAYHYFECAWAGNAAKAVEYCRRAADQAMARLAYEGAADLYDRALHALEEVDEELPDRDDQQAELLVARCEALLAAGDVVSAAGAVSQLQAATRDSARLAAWGTCFDGQLSMLTDPERLDEIESAVAAAAEKLAGLDDAAGEAKAHTVRAACLARLGRIGDCRNGVGPRSHGGATCAGTPPGERRAGGCATRRAVGPQPGAPRGRSVSRRRAAAAHHDGIAGRRGDVDAVPGRARCVSRPRRRRPAACSTPPDARSPSSACGTHYSRSTSSQASSSWSPTILRPPSRIYGGPTTASAAWAWTPTPPKPPRCWRRACLALDRDAEADELCTESERLAGHALKASIAWRTVRAQLLARSGAHDEARRVAEEAVALAERTDALVDHGDACLALATVLRAAGDDAGARAAAERAVGLYELKGAAALAEKARSILGAELPAVPAPPEAPVARAGQRMRASGANARGCYSIAKPGTRTSSCTHPTASLESRRKIRRLLPGRSPI